MWHAALMNSTADVGSLRLQASQSPTTTALASILASLQDLAGRVNCTFITRRGT